MIALTAAILPNLSTVRTWQEFAHCVLNIHTASGLSYSDLEKLSRNNDRELKRSTVSDALNGKRRITKPLLESLLDAWKLPAAERAEVLSTWSRVATDALRRTGPAVRFDEVSPRDLGVHPAIQVNDATSDLPDYVPRDFDDQLAALIAEGSYHGCFVVLVGRSSTGKTRSLYEAIYKIVPNWRIVQPSSTQEIVDFAAEPTEGSIVWLDELHRFLGSSPPLTRAVVSQLKNAGSIVVGTLWSDDYIARKELRQTNVTDRYAEDRKLLESAEKISVHDVFGADEYRKAREVGKWDARIRIALQSRDAGLTQVLAAGPELVERWEHAPPYPRAAMTAAADARRLGVRTPLPPDLLREAMTGYLTPAERVLPPAAWLDEATAYGETKVSGAVAALCQVAGPHSGVPAGYVAADYLAQHLARVRRTQCPPESTWIALIERLDNADDLRRVCAGAEARMRYRYWEPGLRRLCALGDRRAHVELAMLLTRQARIPEGMAALRDQMDDKRARDTMKKLIELAGRAERLHSDDIITRLRLAELLFDEGDTAELRENADRGDQVAADDLAVVLAERGDLAELRVRADAGHRLAADLLAELLAIHGRLAELRERAESGDEAATTRLGKIGAGPDEAAGSAVEAQISELRAAVDAGMAGAAEQLTGLLFELRSELDLRAEVDAGTPYAAERLLALLTAENSYDPHAVCEILRLRAFGLDAGGNRDGIGSA
jgi:hypothetical protein